MAYVYLGLAILSEVVATSTLKASESFTKPLPSLVVIVGYGSAFYLLSRCLDRISVGVAYAIWSGLGMVLVTMVGAVAYRQVPDRAGVIGIALILAGVVVLNLWSKGATH